MDELASNVTSFVLNSKLGVSSTSATTITPIGRDQNGAQMTCDSDDNNDFLCVWAHPQHVAGLEKLTVGGLIMVMGQMQFANQNLADFRTVTCKAARRAHGAAERRWK